jgi:hypothetical protein
VRSAKYTTKKLPTSNLFECWELFFGVYLFGTNKSCFLFFFAECERFGQSQKRGQKATEFLKQSQKRGHSFLIASAGDMRVTKYDGPTSIRIDATARPILISNHAENDSCTGTWST